MSTAEQYIIDDTGKKIVIILPLDEYEQIKEGLHDLVVVAERRDEKTISLDQLKTAVVKPAMADYRITVKASVEKDIRKIPADITARILEHIESSFSRSDFRMTPENLPGQSTVTGFV